MPVSSKTILGSGLTGPQGNQGAQGTAGAQGPQGSNGVQGSQGATGPQGSQGSQGSQGTAGAQGAIGNQGPQGAQGSQGNTGSLGPTGPQGPQGRQGSAGPQGAQGALQAWSRKTANYTAVDGDRLIADTSGGVFTVTLPATPSTGAYIQITDGNDFSGNNLTVARNGSTIDGNADDVLLDLKGVTFEFIYDGTTWEVTGTTGAAGQQGSQGVAGTQGPQGAQGAAGSGGGGSLGPWEIKTANYTAVDGDRILAISNTGAFTITLPATPSSGHSVIIADGNDFSTNNVTVARNGSTIEGLSENLVLDVQGIQVDLVYDGTTWETFTTTGIGSTLFATLDGIESLSNKTLTNPSVNGAIIEEIFTITDGAGFEIDPTNGTIQFITLGASRTPKGTNFINGESVTLMIDDGSAYSLTWTDTTFGASGVTWVGGSAPTLDTTKLTVIELWRANNQVYGALVGAA
jgi:hypothetical protein